MVGNPISLSGLPAMSLRLSCLAAAAALALTACVPIPIIVPCHRVIGANGTLTGFGGGLPTKKWLLEHEGISTPRLI